MWVRKGPVWITTRARHWIGERDGEAFYIAPAIHPQCNWPIVVFGSETDSESKIHTLHLAWEFGFMTERLWWRHGDIFFPTNAYLEVGICNGVKYYLHMATRRSADLIPGCVIIEGDPNGPAPKIVGEWLSGKPEPDFLSDSVDIPGLDKIVFNELLSYLEEKGKDSVAAV